MAYDPVAHGARCRICPLKGNIVVPPAPVRAPSKLRAIIVGEGPGRVEERSGAPFVGPSGAFLNTFLRDQPSSRLPPVQREEIHITNAMLCRGESDKEVAAAELCCAPRLLNELRVLDRKAPIIALGASAARQVLGVRSIMMARGFVWTVKSIDPTAVRTALRAWQKLKAKRGSPRQNAILHCSSGFRFEAGLNWPGARSSQPSTRRS